MSGSIKFLQHIWSNQFNNNEQTVGGGNCIESIFCKAWPDKWLSLTRMEPRLLLYSHRDRRQTSYFPQSNSQGTTENELALINTIQLPLSLSLSLVLLTQENEKHMHKYWDTRHDVQNHI